MSSQPTNDPRQLEADLEPLRRGYAFAEETPEPESCPEPERMWAAVHGEMPADEARELIEHTLACPSCAEEWRLARDVGRQTAETAQTAPESAGGRVLRMAHRFRRAAVPLLAAAAALLIVVGLPRDSPQPPGDFRAGETETIRSLLPRDEVLTRQDCLLRWSEVEGALYTVTVSDADLEVVAQAEDLAQPQFRVPAKSLATLEAGVELYWQVEAVMPDGSKKSSSTFVSRLE